MTCSRLRLQTSSLEDLLESDQAMLYQVGFQILLLNQILVISLPPVRDPQVVWVANGFESCPTSPVTEAFEVRLVCNMNLGLTGGDDP